MPSPPGTTHYVKDPAKPGGVWRGEAAIVIDVGGVAQIVTTKQTGDTSFIPRVDKPGANTFEKDGDWLAGENVKLLYPIDPALRKRVTY